MPQGAPSPIPDLRVPRIRFLTSAAGFLPTDLNTVPKQEAPKKDSLEPCIFWRAGRAGSGGDLGLGAGGRPPGWESSCFGKPKEL